MLTGKAFIIGGIIFFLSMLGVAHAMADARMDEEDAADEWEKEYAKERDGSGV